MPSKVHTDAKVQELLDLFTAAKDGWTFTASNDSELVELMQYTSAPTPDDTGQPDARAPRGDDGFLFTITYVTATSERGEFGGAKTVTGQNTVLFRNDVDGTQSRVQVIDRKGRRVAGFPVNDVS